MVRLFYHVYGNLASSYTEFLVFQASYFLFCMEIIFKQAFY